MHVWPGKASGSRANTLTAAFASLPCPGLPEGHAAARAADARAGARSDSNGAAAAPPFTETVRSWTPGIPAGARTWGEPCFPVGVQVWCLTVRGEEASSTTLCGKLQTSAS